MILIHNEFPIKFFHSWLSTAYTDFVILLSCYLTFHTFENWTYSRAVQGLIFTKLLIVWIKCEISNMNSLTRAGSNEKQCPNSVTILTSYKSWHQLKQHQNLNKLYQNRFARCRGKRIVKPGQGLCQFLSRYDYKKYSPTYFYY